MVGDRKSSAPGRTPPDATMFRSLRRTARRLARPAVALVLVLAQAVAAFGFPAVRPRAGAHPGVCGHGLCGCGNAPGACCCVGVADGTRSVPVTTAAAEPRAHSCCEPKTTAKPAACSKCCDPEPVANPAPAGLTWVPEWQARHCHGEGPLGLLAELPSIPPAIPPGPHFVPTPAGHLTVPDENPHFISTDPLEPPPRCR